MTAPGDTHFLSRPSRPKFDWELVLAQVEGNLERAPDDSHRLRSHKYLLEQLETERGLYRRDFLLIAKQAHREMAGMFSDDPEWVQIQHGYWSRHRASVRQQMAWLDKIEELLDAELTRFVGDGD